MLVLVVVFSILKPLIAKILLFIRIQSSSYCVFKTDIGELNKDHNWNKRFSSLFLCYPWYDVIDMDSFFIHVGCFIVFIMYVNLLLHNTKLIDKIKHKNQTKGKKASSTYKKDKILQNNIIILTVTNNVSHANPKVVRVYIFCINGKYMKEIVGIESDILMPTEQ